MLVNKALAERLGPYLQRYDEGDAAKVYAAEIFSRANDALAGVKEKYAGNREATLIIERMQQDAQRRMQNVLSTREMRATG